MICFMNEHIDANVSYRIESGHVEISRDRVKLTQLGPGAAFGEISILTNRSQVSATIVRVVEFPNLEVY